MKRKLLLTFIVVAAILLITIFVFPRGKNQSTRLTTSVQKGPFEILVFSTGQLEYKSLDNIYIPEELKNRQTRVNNLTISDIVEEGTYVDSGDYVATLDHEAVDEQLKNVMDELEKTASEYEDSKIDSNLTLSNQRDQIVNAELDLEEREISVEESVYESPSVQKKGKMDLDKAKRRLEQTKKAYQLKQQQEANKVARRYITYKQVKERATALRNLRDALIITSPKAGTISYHKYPFGGSVKTGSRVSQYNPIIASFPNMSNLSTKTFINEIDISLIEKGQSVKIGIDAFPEKQLEGEVVSVANMGQLMPKSDAKVFEVKIQVHGSDPELKPAMTTSNIIRAGYFEEAVFVPLEAVFTNDSLSFVYPVNNKKVKQIIEPGEKNENYITVLQGLEEGQSLFLSEPENAESLAYSGMEIYEDILRKKEEKKAKANTNQKEPKLPDVAKFSANSKSIQISK